MSLIVQAAPKERWGWLVMRSGCVLTADFQAIEAVDSSGAVRGMVGYDRFSPNSMMCHMAVSSPIVWRSLLAPAFFYPFEQLKLGVLLATISAANHKALKLVQSFGFRETHRVKDGFRVGVDMVLHEMRREECRWLRGPTNGIRKAS